MPRFKDISKFISGKHVEDLRVGDIVTFKLPMDKDHEKMILGEVSRGWSHTACHVIWFKNGEMKDKWVKCALLKKVQ